MFAPFENFMLQTSHSKTLREAGCDELDEFAAGLLTLPLAMAVTTALACVSDVGTELAGVCKFSGSPSSFFKRAAVFDRH